MLTGDKGETARVIGISCGILSQPYLKTNIKQIIIDGDINTIEELLL